MQLSIFASINAPIFILVVYASVEYLVCVKLNNCSSPPPTHTHTTNVSTRASRQQNFSTDWFAEPVALLGRITRVTKSDVSIKSMQD
jgi:hypothetical protein